MSIPENYKPISIGHRLRIVRKGYKPPEEPGRIDIIIERGAFGSGEHETTISCLEEMEKLDLFGKSVLDVGCGTGILAIAALKLGATRAVAFDIAREAVKTTLRNAELNKVSDKITVILGTIGKIKGVYDIVLANIYPEILKDIAEDIKKRTNTGGILILSGIPWEDNSEILRTYKSLGFEVLENRFLEYYTTAVLKLVQA